MHGRYLVAALLGAGLRYRQVTHKLVLAQVPRDLAEGLAFARGHVVKVGRTAVGLNATGATTPVAAATSAS